MPAETLPIIANGVPTRTVQELVTEAARKNITCEFCIMPSAFNENPITIRIIGLQKNTELDYIPEHIANAHVVNMQQIGKSKPLYMLTIGTDVHLLVECWNNQPKITLHPSLKDAWTAMYEAVEKCYNFNFNFNGKEIPAKTVLEKAKTVMKEKGQYWDGKLYLSPMSAKIKPNDRWATKFYICPIPHNQSSGLICERESE